MFKLVAVVTAEPAEHNITIEKLRRHVFMSKCNTFLQSLHDVFEYYFQINVINRAVNLFWDDLKLSKCSLGLLLLSFAQ